MKNSANASDCQSLMEACTLELYQKSIFRITGLPVDATSKEVARQVQKLQMMEEMSGGGTPSTTAAFPLAPPPTTEQTREALARMKEPELRLVDEFFWYWPEKFGDSKNDPAIRALLSGDGQAAIDLWVDRENDGSIVAKHNLAVMFHMFALDWTNHHVAYEIDAGRDEKIKSYWRDSFQRWEILADSDELWDVVKDRVRSLEDEALTTGFVRRMRRVLPQALDRVNAEAALKLAEQGQMDWAKFHVDFMRETNQGLDDVDSTAELVLAPTRRRIDQRLQAAQSKSEETPDQGTQLASELMNAATPLMGIYDLFHGKEAHQRNDLFDGVAETVADLLVAYQKATGDDQSFVKLLKQALQFASGMQIRERLMRNIAIGENNLAASQLAPIFKSLNAITESSQDPSQKLQQVQRTIMTQLPSWASALGPGSETYSNLVNTVAIALRNISIAAHNDTNDTSTATAAIGLALKLAVDPDLKRRMMDDKATLDGIMRQQKQWDRTVKIRSDEFEITQDFVRYNSTKISSADITGLRFGIFTQITNGIASSSYKIGVRGRDAEFSVECKRFFRSDAQAKIDFTAILESLFQQILPNYVTALANNITSGRKTVQIGPLQLTKNGVNCETGSLWWKKQILVPYTNLGFADYQGHVHVSAAAPEKIHFALDRREVWNAVILEKLVEIIKLMLAGNFK
ncbi:hypothetical protein [Prosthecobacter sp.]|uniref:hypothetical protein n=1 Tax=Prosthecobacter sp. TaxID=1965333 RepID=UPI00378531E2